MLRARDARRHPHHGARVDARHRRGPVPDRERLRALRRGQRHRRRATTPTRCASIPNGQIFAEVGNVTLRVGDDVHTHQNSRDPGRTATSTSSATSATSTPAAAPTEFGTTMILRGQIIADCVVTSTATPTRPATRSAAARRRRSPVPAHETQHLGQQRRRHVPVRRRDRRQRLPAADDPRLRDAVERRLHLPRLEDASCTAAQTRRPRPTTDGEDRFIVWYLQSMNVDRGARRPRRAAPGAGHTPHARRPGARPTTTRSTRLGSHGDRRNYVINVLDTGASNDGVDEAAIYGWDTTAAEFNGYVPAR